MNKDFYLNQVNRLIQAFGEKGFTEEKIKTLWERIKNCDAGRFEQIVSDQILSNYNPPPLKVFIDLASSSIGSSFKEGIQYEFDCSWCGQSGAVEAIQKEDPVYRVSFRCICGEFKNKLRIQDERFIYWSSNLLHKYEPQFYHFDKPGDIPYKIPHKKTVSSKEELNSLINVTSDTLFNKI